MWFQRGHEDEVIIYHDYVHVHGVHDVHDGEGNDAEGNDGHVDMDDRDVDDRDVDDSDGDGSCISSRDSCYVDWRSNTPGCCLLYTSPSPRD